MDIAASLIASAASLGSIDEGRRSEDLRLEEVLESWISAAMAFEAADCGGFCEVFLRRWAVDVLGSSSSVLSPTSAEVDAVLLELSVDFWLRGLPGSARVSLSLRGPSVGIEGRPFQALSPSSPGSSLI